MGIILETASFAGIILEAASFAKLKHSGQTRKYNGTPYIFHPCRVAGRLATHRDATDEMVAAAYLHDVLEDTGTTVEELRSKFGTQVAELVDSLTNKSKETGLPRAERKRLDKERISEICYRAKLIKLMDRIDNLREIDLANDAEFAKMYANESLSLLEVLRDVDDELTIELETVIKGILCS